jgi:ribonuclease Z
MDHLAGLPYYLSQRSFQGMQPGTVVLPRELERPVDTLLRHWRDVERQGTPYKLIGLSAGEDYPVRRDFCIRGLQTHHGGPSLGYALISVREKLKAEYLGIPGPEIAAMRKRGVEVQYRLEVPLITYLGDTAAGAVFDQPEVQNAQILITECTFFESIHKHRAKVGRHLHLDQLLDILPKLHNQQLILTHLSRRTGIGKAKRFLAKRVGPEKMANIHFLMDFEGSENAGDVEEAGPWPPDNAE